MKTKQVCVECNSDDLKSLAPAFPHILECGNCGHPNDAPTKKAEPIEKKCEMCNRRKATTSAIKPFKGDTIDVCDKCFDDIIDEESE